MSEGCDPLPFVWGCCPCREALGQSGSQWGEVRGAEGEPVRGQPSPGHHKEVTPGLQWGLLL